MNMVITSVKNQRVREVAELCAKTSARKKRKAYVVEGIKMFREIPKEDLLEVWFSEQFEKEHFKELLELPKEIPTFSVSDPVFEKISDTMTPQGVLAVVRQKQYSLEELLLGKGEVSGKNDSSFETKEAPFFLLLENLQDPGNLGTILRSGEGAGVTGVILSADSVDLYNPKVVRSTMGAVFRLPVLVSEDLKQTVNELKATKIRVYAAHLDSGSKPYDLVDWNAPSAVLIGNESKGLSEEMTACADEKVHIPMLGRVESLNAAVAASLIAFEAARVKRNPGQNRV